MRPAAQPFEGQSRQHQLQAPPSAAAGRSAKTQALTFVQHPEKSGREWTRHHTAACLKRLGLMPRYSRRVPSRLDLDRALQNRARQTDLQSNREGGWGARNAERDVARPAPQLPRALFAFSERRVTETPQAWNSQRSACLGKRGA